MKRTVLIIMVVILIMAGGIMGLAVFTQKGREHKMAVSSIGDSTFDEFKILKTGTITLTHTANSEVTTASVTHGLGFAPTAVVYELTALDTTTAKTQIPYSLPISASLSATHVGKTIYAADFTTAADTLTIFVYTPNIGVSSPPYDYSTAFTIYYKYYILRERSSQ